LLEVHSGTPLAEHIRRGIQPKPDEDLAAVMYEWMLEQAAQAGYEHYEISNLCLPALRRGTTRSIGPERRISGLDVRRIRTMD
jgi:oxygen-independent coproporphyrinogen-3 oxidase